MDRVVLDPAVLVSALITPSGNPALLWQAVRDRRLALVTSPRLLGELAGVLARPKFRRYVTEEEAEAEEFRERGCAARNGLSRFPRA